MHSKYECVASKYEYRGYILKRMCCLRLAAHFSVSLPAMCSDSKVRVTCTADVVVFAGSGVTASKVAFEGLCTSAPSRSRRPTDPMRAPLCERIDPVPQIAGPVVHATISTTTPGYAGLRYMSMYMRVWFNAAALIVRAPIICLFFFFF